MKAIDLTVNDLCQQIDYWKSEAEYWKEMYQTEQRERTQEWNERFEETKKAVGDALRLALSVREGTDGSLIIPAEERKQLADSYRD